MATSFFDALQRLTFFFVFFLETSSIKGLVEIVSILTNKTYNTQRNRRCFRILHTALLKQILVLQTTVTDKSNTLLFALKPRGPFRGSGGAAALETGERAESGKLYVIVRESARTAGPGPRRSPIHPGTAASLNEGLGASERQAQPHSHKQTDRQTDPLTHAPSRLPYRWDGSVVLTDVRYGK